MSDDISDRDYDVYLQERASLVDSKREATRLFDRAILTLAAGAFGLSLAFVRQILADTQPRATWVLVVAWATFCVSMVSTLVSFLTSQHACSEQIDILEKEYFDKANRNKETIAMKNVPGLWTRGLNISSMVFFILGVALLATFASMNI